MSELNTWTDDLVDAVIAGTYPHITASDPPSGSVVSYDWTTVEGCIEGLANMNMLTGFAGNAYKDAPNCIRSCIWVPFPITNFGVSGYNICLGQFETNVNANICKTVPVDGSASVSIPWQFSDWRRAVCEEIYLYLPLVGMVNIPSDEIINESTIAVTWSATATDGCICYKVNAGNQTIGTFGANCAVNYPIGISQQASAGEIVQTAMSGMQKTLSSAIQAGSSLNPAGMAVGVVGTTFDFMTGAYNTVDKALTAHNSCIGGIGGGAGVGLSLNVECYSVAHPTVIEPDNMQSTMGVPTMQPLTLSSLTGFCQCANAHVAADGAEASELAEIDGYLNSGFYIE